MRERHLELARQASILAEQDIGKISPAFLKEYSDLIIQECAQQLEANRLAVYDANLHHEYWNCGVKWAVAKLKNHFENKLKYIDCNSQ